MKKKCNFLVFSTLISLLLNLLPLQIFTEEIFLSATKEGLKEKFIPSNAIIIKRQEIEKTNAKNLGELIDILTTADVGHYGTLGSLKSLKLRNSTSEQVLILLNGVPLNSSAKGSVNLSLIPTDIVEKIEILSGSSSALYGANAVGGVVNIITKQAKENKIASNFSYGSFNSYIIDTNLEVNKSNYEINVIATNQHSDGWRKNSKYDYVCGYVNFSIPILYGKFNFNTITQNSQAGTPGVSIVAMNQWDGEIEKEASTPYAKQSDSLNIITLGYEDNLVNSKLSFDIQKLVYDNSQDIFWPEKTDSSLNTINFLNTITLPYKFFVSLNYNYTKLDQKYPLNTTDNFNKDVSNLGLGIQKEFNYNNLNFIPTIRWDSNSLFGNKFSPQVIFVYNLNQTKLSLMTGTSWRAPTFLDLYWPNQVWIKGNPKLQPEESYSVDCALENNFGQFKLIFNPFYRYLKGQIRWYPEDETNLWSAWIPSNVDETVVQGIEVKSDFKISKIFDNKLSILISDTKIKKKGEEHLGWQKQAYSPLYITSYYSSLLLPHNFILINSIKYTDTQYSKDGESGIKLDNFILWNTKIEKEIHNYVKLYLQINDLLNQKGVNRVGYPQPGRNYEFGLNVNIKI